MQNTLFRQVALDKLSSPDDLDQLVRVTDARGWISLAATSAVIATAVAWSLFGTIRTTVPGRGVLIREGGVSRIVSNTAGRIIELKLVDDGQVKAGDVVAVIAPAEPARDLGVAVQTRLNSAEAVRSTKSGDVVSLQAEVGDVVGVGTVLADIEPAGKPLLAAVYVAATDGKKIAADAPAQISPAEVSREEYGFVRGRVRSVSRFPATQGEMTELLSNDNLVQALSSGGAPYQVLVDLGTDPKTPSGLQWSSSRTPDIRISSGGVCVVDIVIREQRPIELVIPYLREKLGL